MRNQSRGFGPLAIVLVIAAVLAIGGGSYYAAKKAKNNDHKEVKTNVTASTTVTSSNQKTGTFKDIVSLGKSVVCTISESTTTGMVSGTAYVSGNSMRGDFTAKAQNGVMTESHMIRNSNDVYVWTAAQGVHMNIDILESQSSNKQQGTGVSWNQQVTYSCSDWKKDETKFALPTSVKFIDLSAMVKGQVKLPVEYPTSR